MKIPLVSGNQQIEFGTTWELRGILLIASACSWGKIDLIRGIFQLLSSSFISWATLQYIIPASSSTLARKSPWIGIQGSCLILTYSPSPILHRNPCSRIFLPSSILLYVKKGFEPSGAFMKLLSGKYLALRILETKEPKFAKIFQPYFANIARLNVWKSLNPSPPLHLGQQSLS